MNQRRNAFFLALLTQIVLKIFFQLCCFHSDISIFKFKTLKLLQSCHASEPLILRSLIFLYCMILTRRNLFCIIPCLFTKKEKEIIGKTKLVYFFTISIDMQISTICTQSIIFKPPPLFSIFLFLLFLNISSFL